MALVIFDVTKKPQTTLGGGLSEKVVRITLDTDYPTGGWAITAAQLGMSAIHFVDVPGVSGYVFQWDYDNAKLMALIGNNDAADGVLIEAAAGDNGLDTLQVRALVRGVAA